jgi:formylglycine-generating enzyme required for sulfatase activity
MFELTGKSARNRLGWYWVIVLITLSIGAVGCQPAEESNPAPTETAVIEASSQNQESAAPEAGEPASLSDRDMPSNDEWEPVIQEFDGVEMALVPAGCFMMGDQELASAQPAHEVCLTEAYWIDLTEVSNGQFERLGGQAANTVGFPGQDIAGDDLPRTSVTWEEANAFCQLRGGRLPTEAEWEYAARGPDGLAYPWGNEFEADRLNFCEQSCPFGSTSGGLYFTANDGYDVAAPVSSLPGGASWIGALHMAGNVAEWVADWYDGAYYASSPVENPTGPETGPQRVVKSAPWSWYENVEVNFNVANRWDFVPDGTSRDFSGTTGFRCVRAEG